MPSFARMLQDVPFVPMSSLSPVQLMTPANKHTIARQFPIPRVSGGMLSFGRAARPPKPPAVQLRPLR